ncbi:gluconate 2-dehydrogenase subunit 3 family protein [Arthrobacter sp. I2-34]|uniref:Gluconate 2-dehydrogenase subunit 3 family protein n=1 Tax=Arthrobacter hankyongi TaxID=2904801 RepID=A0ABS9LDC9_9MICC|nr:gluconate 2-dehydrogenase subunit 3 family protein [Arthrobacter hankyongi]MCG2624427.1 gluconate 2-dehydrogenase subunit 3 family protein [Arthrobacter hankyongi]
MPTPVSISLKPPMGGTPDYRFSERHARILDAFADTLIPAGEGFPAPSEVEISGFIARYVTPAGMEPKWYPRLAAEQIGARLDSLADALLDPDPRRGYEAVRAFESSEADAFAVLRELVYFGYYSHAAVVRAINLQLAAGQDYRQTPQPAGYLEGLEAWDQESLAKVRGTYLRTEEVVPLAFQPTFAQKGLSA